MVQHFVEQVVSIGGEALQATERAKEGLAAPACHGRVLLGLGEEGVEALEAGAEAADVAAVARPGSPPARAAAQAASMPSPTSFSRTT